MVSFKVAVSDKALTVSSGKGGLLSSDWVRCGIGWSYCFYWQTRFSRKYGLNVSSFISIFPTVPLQFSGSHPLTFNPFTVTADDLQDLECNLHFNSNAHRMRLCTWFFSNFSSVAIEEMISVMADIDAIRGGMRHLN